MAWTAPRTWTTGELVTASIMNVHVRDNELYLKGQAGAVGIENAIDLTQIATPAAPGASLTRFYAKTDGLLYIRIGAAGAETTVGGSGLLSAMLLMGG